MDWFEILKGARSLCKNPEDSFTAFDLNNQIGFPADSKKSSHRLASAWVCKLVTWGYVVRVGTKPNPGHKPVTLYTVTEKGHNAENTSSTASTKEEVSDLDKLRDAVRSYEGARNAKQASMGKKGEPKAHQEEEKAFLELLALCDELDRKEFGVE